jgi:mannose/cellobiose epimerase-like protein (N-acyl-D-glucosamine 2-epimerase family)
MNASCLPLAYRRIHRVNGYGGLPFMLQYAENIVDPTRQGFHHCFAV